mgnify:CR=1 FL=1
MVEIYRTKIGKIRRLDYRRIYGMCQRIYKNIRSKSKRRPYVRSRFFDNEKIFLELFWVHLYDKNKKERISRLQYFLIALDLLKNSRCKPTSKENVNNKSELLHRFYGVTSQGEEFFVQIKENKHSGQKYFMSVFPVKLKKLRQV